MNHNQNNDHYGIMELQKPRLSRSQESFLNLAKKLADGSDCVQRHGAVLVKSGSVLSTGVNKWRNDVSIAAHLFANDRSTDVSVHAEIDALSRVKNPAGSVMYIARLNKKGKAMLSKPCDNCAKALTDAGVTKVVYTIS